MIVYKLYPGKDKSCAFYADNLHDLVFEITESEAGDRWTIEAVEMTKEELDALPEFGGF